MVHYRNFWFTLIMPCGSINIHRARTWSGYVTIRLYHWETKRKAIGKRCWAIGLIQWPLAASHLCIVVCYIAAWFVTVILILIICCFYWGCCRLIVCKLFHSLITYSDTRKKITEINSSTEQHIAEASKEHEGVQQSTQSKEQKPKRILSKPTYLRDYVWRVW